MGTKDYLIAAATVGAAYVCAFLVSAFTGEALIDVVGALGFGIAVTTSALLPIMLNEAGRSALRALYKEMLGLRGVHRSLDSLATMVATENKRRAELERRVAAIENARQNQAIQNGDIAALISENTDART